MQFKFRGIVHEAVEGSGLILVNIANKNTLVVFYPFSEAALAAFEKGP